MGRFSSRASTSSLSQILISLFSFWRIPFHHPTRSISLNKDVDLRFVLLTANEPQAENYGMLRSLFYALQSGAGKIIGSFHTGNIFCFGFECVQKWVFVFLTLLAISGAKTNYIQSNCGIFTPKIIADTVLQNSRECTLNLRRITQMNLRNSQKINFSSGSSNLFRLSYSTAIHISQSCSLCWYTVHRAFLRKYFWKWCRKGKILHSSTSSKGPGAVQAHYSRTGNKK